MKQNKRKTKKLLKKFVELSETLMLLAVALFFSVLFFKSLKLDEDKNEVLINPTALLELDDEYRTCQLDNVSLCTPPPPDADFLYEEAHEVVVFEGEEEAKDVFSEKFIEISNLVAKGVSFEISPNDENIFANLDTISDENIEKLYEEELSSEILEEDVNTAKEEGYFVYTEHKPIGEIDIKIYHKPPYFGPLPVIAIVIDDMGISRNRTDNILSLNAPLTSSFLTYSKYLNAQIEKAKISGHEVIGHIPMEAKKNIDVAPDVLTTSMSNEDIKLHFINMLAKLGEVKGINNHMGSKFTEDEARMSTIMEVLKEKNMYFLDSKTSGKSSGRKVAKKYEVAYATRHVFLDNENNLEYIKKQLQKTEQVAMRNGYAIAIGHPKSQTHLALKEWLEKLDKNKFRIVHLSKIINALNPQPAEEISNENIPDIHIPIEYTK